MKITCLWMAFTLAINVSAGKIKNGYESGIVAARESIKVLHSQLKLPITASQRRKVESSIRKVTTYIVFYELTESLLEQFHTIAPEIYGELDSIKDRLGRETDVYVEFIPEERARIMAWGVTNVAHKFNDNDAYASVHGDYTVSIKIWTVNNALEVLAHELGHVKYQVPHLSAYMEYYKASYKLGTCDPNYVGHDVNDISGRTAIKFAKRYRKMFYQYWKDGRSHFPSPASLVGIVKRSLQKDTKSLASIL